VFVVIQNRAQIRFEIVGLYGQWPLIGQFTLLIYYTVNVDSVDHWAHTLATCV